jgi:hypothetical protein
LYFSNCTIADLQITSVYSSLNTTSSLLNGAIATQSSIATSVMTEQLRAVSVEGSVASSVAAEQTRALGVESSLGASVSAERVRATGIEGSLASSIAASTTANQNQV